MTASRPNRTVVLGPPSELHAGYHGALREWPPPGVSYVGARWEYRCLLRDGGAFPPNPFDDDSTGEEAVLTGVGLPAVVHSARVPVGGDVGWLVDTDSFLATLRHGPFRPLGCAGAPSSELAVARAAVLVARLLAERCGAVLFWTEDDRLATFRALEHDYAVAPGAIAALWEKTDVVPPGFASRRPVGRDDESAVTVLYMGRTFSDKGGDIALGAFEALDERFGPAVRLVFVGELPPGARVRPTVVHVESVTHQRFLDLLDASDIFFSPTLFESYGVALGEAAAAGLAIVTSCGPGMAHVGEILDDGVHARMVSNALATADRTAAYVEVLAGLIADLPARRAMAAANRRLVGSGRLSLARRDRALLPHYERLWRQPGASRPPVPPVEVPGFTPRTFGEGYVRLERQARTGGRPLRLLLP